MREYNQMNLDMFNAIDDMVCDYYEHIDENTYSDMLFVVKFGLGMEKGNQPDEYMYDIFDRLGIFEGRMNDNKLVEVINTAERVYSKWNEWSDYRTVLAVKNYLEIKEQA